MTEFELTGPIIDSEKSDFGNRHSTFDLQTTLLRLPIMYYDS